MFDDAGMVVASYRLAWHGHEGGAIRRSRSWDCPRAPTTGRQEPVNMDTGDIDITTHHPYPKAAARVGALITNGIVSVAEKDAMWGFTGLRFFVALLPIARPPIQGSYTANSVGLTNSSGTDGRRTS